MEVITATEALPNFKTTTVFLAGGITNCPEWQNDVIERLKDDDNAILLNPRRADFPMDDPNAAKKQIEWEYEALNNATIFSIWFSDCESIQPICLYELGRHLAIRQEQGRLRQVVIGVEPGYQREQDVYIQTKLVDPWINIHKTLDDFVTGIQLRIKSEGN
jgi:hypothetical protein